MPIPINTSRSVIDEKTLAKEKEVIANEINWYLTTQGPVVVEELITKLKGALTYIHFKNEANVADSLTLAVTSSNCDTLKGFITVNDIYVTKGELSIKFPHYNRGNVVKTTFSPKEPHCLYQLQDVYNHIHKIIEILEHYKLKTYTLEQLNDLIKQTIMFLKKIKFIMSQKEENYVFPYRCNPKNFTPELPSDFVVEFYINMSNIVVAIFNISSSHSSQHQFSSKIIGRVKTIKSGNHLSNNKINPSNEIIVECPSPNLLKFNKLMNDIYDIANNCQYKLKIFLEKQ
ncbi:hypothetical protein BCR32DRAFT_249250 [Anaeromyces robustus]|uniref:Uncharacterized protein n=1 Tax=Anaeromyces robustus TaxID=1754192 RepID=A0A1Y1WQJ5_9FUNG|nr:hypothetical protein BCR32DRAFT_249250 [Anaeromyces robustus]|eukprot:ORX75809.1 hypothetical protein BCR32DRAFT_249250 [Anaeromyces robustus]